MEEVEIKYHITHLGWLSLGATIERGLLRLLEWLGFLALLL